VSRADADALFAYLKSLKPVRRANRPNTLRFPYSQRELLLGWRALYFESGEYTAHPGESAEWNRGAYLVQGLGHCEACHTARNMLGATVRAKELGGGLIPMQNWYAPSLTSDREAGLGQWNVADFTALLKTGASRRGIVFGPMAQVVHDSLQYLTESDLRAMGVYLKSLAVEPAPEDLPQVRPTAAQSMSAYDSGARIYDQQCKSCHGPEGGGVPSAYPPLANNQAINMDFAANPIRMVLFGGFPPGTSGNPRPFGMPPFATTLSDDDVAAASPGAIAARPSLPPTSRAFAPYPWTEAARGRGARGREGLLCPDLLRALARRTIMPFWVSMPRGPSTIPAASP
jgi:mono/diheme cytochrome c family protein